LKKALPEADGLSRTPSETTDIVGDIQDLDIDVNNYDIIYHFAAFVGVEKSIKDPIETYRVNVCGTLKIVRSFKGLLIFTSTVGVHEPLKNPYYLSKYVDEHIIRAAPCKHIILRLANPYGAGSNSVVQRWLKANSIQIYGDGEQTRDFTYIEDIIQILKNPYILQPNKTYNVGTGIPTTLNELARQIIELTGEKKIEYLPPREFEIYRLFVKPDIKCETTLKEGLKRCLREENFT